MELIQEINEYLQLGKAKMVKALIRQALAEDIDPKVILEKGLLAGMMELGLKFKHNKVFVAEVLVAASAMHAGLKELEPRLAAAGAEPVGKAVVGTVFGDLHDIGKNLVIMMLKGAGFETYDLGVDVETSVFIDKAEEIGADIICMSALLTTTMIRMEECTAELERRGLRDKYILMVGGAPVTESFAGKIGADFYTSNAMNAAEVAREAVFHKRKGQR